MKTSLGTAVFASWVDNYYAFGDSFHDAIHIAESFEAALLQSWGLLIKPSSRSIMSPQVPADDWDSSKWPRVQHADVLGHLVAADCSPWPCWHRTRNAMWASYWRNCVGPESRPLSLNDRCKLMDRSVRPVLFFRNTRWPFTQQLAEEQNRLQRRMLSRFIQLERWSTEDEDSYYRRRMRFVAGIARERGAWGCEHAKRVVDWANHLSRPRNSSSLATMLFLWRDEGWLQQRRLDPLIGGSQRPGTRLGSGPVHRRWDEAVASARLFIGNQESLRSDTDEL